MIKKWILMGLGSFFAFSAWAEITVTNLVVAQREGAKLVDILYDVSCNITNEVWVTLSISNGTEEVNSSSVTGDVGERVSVGTNKTMVWDMSSDWNGNVSSNMVFGLIVSDEPEGMVLIPEGTNDGTNPNSEFYSLTVNTFYMDKYEVTKMLWSDVYDWAITNGYNFDNAGSGKATNHPVHSVSWRDCVKWCNARSEKEGRVPCYTLSGSTYKTGWLDLPVCNISANGYRLPENDEWEYAARGGLSGKRFPWGDTITHNEANYYSTNSYSYDISPSRGHHPNYADGETPNSSPVGSFPSNEYGLYDMAGNVSEWCNDDTSSLSRPYRGGSWHSQANRAGCKSWVRVSPDTGNSLNGLRTVTQFSFSETNITSVTSISLDSRDYTLLVLSAHGSPIPNIGANIYAWRVTVTCAVDSAVSGQTNRTCVGWSGTGSVPTTGLTNSTGTIVLTNLSSSVIWDWSDYYTVNNLWAENVIFAQRAGTKLVDVSYDVHSTETNRVAVSLSVDDGAIGPESVSGDVGADVSTGAGKSLVWNAGADWDGNVDSLSFEILGEDAQGAGVDTPAGRVRIPAGQNSGDDPDDGAYSLTSSNALFMDESEITKAQWDTVYNWALTNDYIFANAGSGTASNHPVHSISWVDAATWCNARSEMESFVSCYNTKSCDFPANGYRLPTAVEWQYAARGGLSEKRFPWGDTITHSNANYISDESHAYDVSTTRGLHPVYGANTAPQGSGTTNGYGLYAMAGNVKEWSTDSSGANRVLCGGRWQGQAPEARCATVSYDDPASVSSVIGFRTVQRASSSAFAVTGSDIPVDTRDYLLSVSSEHGTPVPSLGTNTYAWHASVTCSVESAVTSGLTNWTSAGWSGFGSVPPEGGTPNVGGIVLTSLTSSVLWNWDTNYWMENLSAGSGSTDPTSGWQLAGSNVQVQATASSGWLFMGWSGDASGDYAQESIIVPMVRPVSVTATFSDDADDDGLLNTNETALGTDPRNPDTDGDGSNDPDELIAGTSPTNSVSVLAVDLAFESFANELSFFGVSGRYYQIEYTDDLGGTWTSLGTVSPGSDAVISEYDFTARPKRFYRVRVSDNPADL